MQCTQSAMGECILRHFHLPRVLGQTPRPWCALELRTVNYTRQVERQRAREDEGGRKRQGQGVL